VTDLPYLDRNNPEFPDTATALTDPNGLLAVGGNLHTNTLINAYSQGIFPWFCEDQPILWWSPSPRMVLAPPDIHIGRSLRKMAKKRLFTITVDTAFTDVMSHCAQVKRSDQDDTWITEGMFDAYCELHKRGIAHSVEAWQNGTLVGGLYGISIGSAFFGESMFSLVSGASKMAFTTLAMQLNTWQYQLIDCQIHTDYLASFGAKEIPRDLFERRLTAAVARNQAPNWRQRWTMDNWGYEG